LNLNYLYFPSQQSITNADESKSFESTWWVWVDSNHRPHPYQRLAK